MIRFTRVSRGITQVVLNHGLFLSLNQRNVQSSEKISAFFSIYWNKEGKSVYILSKVYILFSSKMPPLCFQIKWQISFFKKCLLAFSCGHSTRICLCIKKGCAIIHTGKRTKIVTKWSYLYCNIFERASFLYSIGAGRKYKQDLESEEQK